MISNAVAVFTTTYDRGYNHAYGRSHFNKSSKVQHLEAVSSEKPNRENMREDRYDKKSHTEQNRFKTYSKMEVEKFHQGAKETARIYDQWKHDIAESAADFIHTFKGELKELNEPITDTYKDKVSTSLEQFISSLKIELETSLKNSPMGQVKKHLKSAQELLETIHEMLWHQIEDLAKEHVPAIPEIGNGGENNPPKGGGIPKPEIPPVVSPADTLPSSQLFLPGTFKMEIKVGSLSSVIKFSDPSKQGEGTPMFYIVDGYGNKKAVTISFSNDTLQKLFDERLKHSKLFKKDISLERFNVVVKKIEAHLKELAAINPERLKSKVHGKKETEKLNKLIDDFAELFYSLRK